LEHRQHARLGALVTHARAESPYYQRLYRSLPADGWSVRDLPPVTKPDLMHSFDDRVIRADLGAGSGKPARLSCRSGSSDVDIIRAA